MEQLTYTQSDSENDSFTESSAQHSEDGLFRNLLEL